mmetsp:Transcript_2076/g.4423  ORF Transcript_2076/g.4423 Transcript_2076/m.4423 type:complete len:123 (+) Transcript_2076:149-517(+)|eukprot:CAMPEP_0172604432 /NCGR_PEP_ID=MMETSP1068-20121228/24676_1 /TAXON_ID=35684 /ORGANISM="Pseudopedinella elastica, Strain CCMP716" /LENGTH=122 /DNA_ID=CAMNT_0013406491 /DNA_START=113 /DNA_END=481 /DNA_ORIENTATION=+
MVREVTKKHRPKRPDARPNPIKRRAERKKANAAKTAEDLRVVRKKKSEHADREIDTSEPLRAVGEAAISKKVRALNKKLTQIEELKKRQKNGEELDEAQLQKVDSLGETLELLDEFLAGKRQ